MSGGADDFLPYGRHVIEDDDVAAVVDVLRGNTLTTGPAVEKFEAALCQAVGAPHAVVCGNGTQALHLAALAVGLGPGDWAIVPSITFLATANAVRMTGADVVFADVDADTGLLTLEGIAKAASRAGGRIKAVMPVHLAGRACDLQAIYGEAANQGWRVVDDACHALGTRVADEGDGWRVGDGRFSDASCFSFHPVKTAAMGEGGAITTRDASIAAAMRRFRSHGMVRDQAQFLRPELGLDRAGAAKPWYYEMADLGWNYRAPDLLCALGTSQLAKLERFVDRRLELVQRYEQLLAPLSPIVRRIGAGQQQRPGWHLCTVLIDFETAGIDRGTAMRDLAARGIGTQVHYIPVAWQPYYRGLYGEHDLPGAASYYARTLSLPLFPSMRDSDVDRVVEQLAAVLSLR
ncbi:UDP-4-amino-4,6-dideoxy-N-acetyl-beta-L-altrosamine transaminase [Roseiterribacter gracilis]|uniref:UDP-4-amino-4, 6-dideoxy-N-acetyl-beta-L-altrosami ne transaminase n=1 Tax=Roseiterribacter gracilis TaxID=2812848 RepID=A0A8S8XJV9_9PROT|nr:UDP-4-amino-4,6-dideoxy-N-acetyl-beta-L-altrosami ne transaminase [Rhodospirillales bacterium TMPK1]